VIVDGEGGPLGVVVAGANVHDTKLLKKTIEAMIVQRPDPQRYEQHLCLDKGYDNPTGHATVAEAQYTPHIRRIGEEKLAAGRRKRHKPRRWVVERTLAWLSKCRAILVRYAKKSSNYLALIQLACILLWFRRLHRLKSAI
jgi:putative transposase